MAATYESVINTPKLRAVKYTGGVKYQHESVGTLIDKLLTASDPVVRQEAAWALWKIRDSRANGPLLQAFLKDKSASVREKAARALGLIGAREAEDIMIKILGLGRHVPAKIRAAIASSLGLFAGEKSARALFEAAEDVEPSVRAEATQALGRLLMGGDRSIQSKLFYRLKKYVNSRHEPLAEVRRAAVRALRFSKDSRANEVVAGVLQKDPDPKTRAMAAEALVVWNSLATEDALVLALSDDFWPVRKAAALSLARAALANGVHRSKNACEALSRIERMFSPSSVERSLATQAMASLRRPDKNSETIDGIYRHRA